MDRPVFVTGATGLVGSWLVKRLVALGADVVCLIRDWVPESELLQSTWLGSKVSPEMGFRMTNKMKIVRGDVRDQAVLERALGEYEIDTVIHLAAQTIVGIANCNPVSTFESNIGGTWALLEACRRSPRVKQIVVASSDKAYGESSKLPYEEDSPLDGVHPYDVSKSCSDLIARSYARTHKLPIIITRCGNFYGGGDLNWNRIIPGTIRSILRGQRPVIRSDGRYVRDYFYVEDGAYVYTLLAEELSKNQELRGEAFNFSNEIQISVFDLVSKIQHLMGDTEAPIVMNEASNEIRHQYLSSEKARRTFGWSPIFSFDVALKRTVDWYKDFFEGGELEKR